MHDSLVVVILAAGASTRLGRPKQLLRPGDKSLVRQVSEMALATKAAVVVVLGAQADLIGRQLADLDLDIAVNAHWPQGLSSSLKLGIDHASHIKPDLCGVLVLLVDQPLINLDHLNKIISQSKGDKEALVVTSFTTGKGVPAYIGSVYFKEIQDISGDRGARSLFTKNREIIKEVPLAGAALDIDTEEDWQKYLNDHFDL